MKPIRRRGSSANRIRRRRAVVLLLGVGIALVIAALFIVRPAWHLLWTWYRDPVGAVRFTPGTVNDASRLNETAVLQMLAVPKDHAEAEAQLRDLLTRAREEKLRVSIAGARHSMGGHTIYPGGVAIDMLPFNHMQLDAGSDILHVGAGARWEEILPYLNERGKSVGVMQSNNSFSVGGSISVNCHGWQTGKPPISSTVESLRLMLADGSIVTCSREENPELFSLVLGGYGLFGIILDVDLRIVDNEVLRLERIPSPIADYAQTQSANTAEGTDAVLAYGRLEINPRKPLGSALLNVWKREPDLACTTAPMSTLAMPEIRRAIFRGSVGDAYGKRLRWWAERELEPWIGSDCSTRNELLNVGVELFENRSESDTDILHEYFIPPDRFEAFVDRARLIISKRNANLLNVTVRDVEPDTDTFLRYADQRMLCLVMLFNQLRTEQAEQQMSELTRELIDAALAEGGRYYLTYRLHATQSQIRRAYPNLDEFFAKKRHYDPAEIFQNKFYRKYGTPSTAEE